MTTMKRTTALLDALKERSSGEIHAVVSNPTDQPRADRWRIEAYGVPYETMGTVDAFGLLSVWNMTLGSAGVVPLTKAQLPRAHRATLFRTPASGWTVHTQAMDGVPVTGSWTLKAAGTVAAEVAEAVAVIATEKGYSLAWPWMEVPDREHLFVSVYLKD